MGGILAESGKCMLIHVNSALLAHDVPLCRYFTFLYTNTCENTSVAFLFGTSECHT